MNQYYYLISSLHDLIIDDSKTVFATSDFLGFCKEELSEKDFTDLKKIFLFHDIQNVINFEKEDDKYVEPAFYSKGEFLEKLKDKESFFEFIATHYFNQENGIRLYPEHKEIDELVILFYDYLFENEENDFIRSYFNFELDLQNITTALAGRKEEMDVKHKILPQGDTYQRLLKNSNMADYGLSGDIGYIEELMDIYKSDDLVKIEKTIEEIRWNYLDEALGHDTFSLNAVIAYGVKLKSIDRWKTLETEEGQSILDELIEKIKSSIEFSQDFNISGGKK